MSSSQSGRLNPNTRAFVPTTTQASRGTNNPMIRQGQQTQLNPNTRAFVPTTTQASRGTNNPMIRQGQQTQLNPNARPFAAAAPAAASRDGDNPMIPQEQQPQSVGLALLAEIAQDKEPLDVGKIHTLLGIIEKFKESNRGHHDVIGFIYELKKLPKEYVSAIYKIAEDKFNVINSRKEVNPQNSLDAQPYRAIMYYMEPFIK